MIAVWDVLRLSTEKDRYKDPLHVSVEEHE